MTAREVLDGIRGRLTAATPGEWWTPSRVAPAEVFSGTGLGDDRCVAEGMEKPDAVFIAAAPTDVARLVAAVEAVLGLHVPDTYGECRQCHGGNGFYHAYPCPTVTAVEAALKEGE